MSFIVSVEVEYKVRMVGEKYYVDLSKFLRDFEGYDYFFDEIQIVFEIFFVICFNIVGVIDEECYVDFGQVNCEKIEEIKI